MRHSGRTTRKSAGRQALLESLEGRRLLAGNVTAVDDGTTLTITGDNKSNQIEVLRHNGFGGYVVTGLDSTTVNGGAFFSEVTGLGVYRNVVVDMGNGQDEVYFNFTTESFYANNLSVETGNGRDLVSITRLGVGGDVYINTGNGPDTIIRSDTQVIGGDLTIDGGNGPDTLDESGLDLIFSSVGGTTTVLDIETFV